MEYIPAKHHAGRPAEILPQGLFQVFPGERIGEKYRKKYGSRYSCASPRARDLWVVFSARCQELGLLYEMRHIISAATRSYGDRQLSFFD